MIITRVTLPKDIATPLDNKAQYNSMNVFEKARYDYDIRLKNDAYALTLIEQQRSQERTRFDVNFKKDLAEEERELKEIQKDTVKKVKCLEAGGVSEASKIATKTELDAQIIDSERIVRTATLNAVGDADVRKINVNAACYKDVTLSIAQATVAFKNADTVKIEGNAEGELKAVLASRRLYAYLNDRLNVIRALAHNKNVKIFGKQNDNALSQLAAYRLMGDNQI